MWATGRLRYVYRVRTVRHDGANRRAPFGQPRRGTSCCCVLCLARVCCLWCVAGAGRDAALAYVFVFPSSIKCFWSLGYPPGKNTRRPTTDRVRDGLLCKKHQAPPIIPIPTAHSRQRECASETLPTGLTFDVCSWAFHNAGIFLECWPCNERSLAGIRNHG